MSRATANLARRRLGAAAGGFVLMLGIAGCHSAFVQTALTNNSPSAIRLFELDYPSASFGGQELASGATFRYRFKVVGDGPVKLTWTDAVAKEHTSTGPALREGNEGRLSVSIGPDAAQWKLALNP